MNTNTSKIIDDAENNITITKNLDNGACERCGCLWCEDDVEFENHMLFGSNKDGKNICRRCVREEDVNPKHHCLKCDKINEDWEEHCKRMCQIAWSNGAFKAREACAKLCEDSVEYAGEELARQIRAGAVDDL